MKMKIKIKGFTLAEVLITLGIIGVVAAMTIPTVMKKYEEIQLKSAFKKEYATLSAAYQNLVVENGGDLAGVYTLSTFGDALSKKLRIAKYCPVGKASECLPNLYNYKFLNGLSSGNTHPSGCGTRLIGHPENSTTWVSMVLSDGSILTIYNWFKDFNATDAYIKNSSAYIFSSLTIDVNGTKPPNTSGKDLFTVIVYKDVIKPAGMPINMAPYTLNYSGCTASQSCAPTGDGSGCAAKVLGE